MELGGFFGSVGSGWVGLVLVIIACPCYLHCGPFEWKVLACLLMNIKVMTLKHSHIRGLIDEFRIQTELERKKFHQAEFIYIKNNLVFIQQLNSIQPRSMQLI